MKNNFTLPVSQDTLLQGIRWEPEQIIEAKGILVLCHGMAEHIKRYDAFASFIAQKGFIVVGYDQRGHGMTLTSMDDMGYMSDVDNFEAMIGDLYSIVEDTRKQFPKLPLIVLGHSMGSFILQRFVELYGMRIDGAIFSGSALNGGPLITIGNFLACLITKFKGRRYRSQLMDAMSLGPFNKPFKPNRTKVDWLSRDEAEVDKYVADPYCGKLFTVSYFLDLTHCFKVIGKNFELIPQDLPIYMFSGEKDPVGGQSKLSTKLFKKFLKIGIKDVSFKLYPDGRHEMLNELNKQEVYQDVLSWLEAHTA
ncbi:MAG: lysophospholipase [Bacilli bacterium]|nr:lysophospholipase [Bacilli bacterium]